MLGQTRRGLALLDEAMVAVTAGEISPVASGIVYCEVIGSCHLAFDVRRAQEWTIALDRWCGERPDMVMFSGQCQAHRAELYCLHGAWSRCPRGGASRRRIGLGTATGTPRSARGTSRARCIACAARSRRRRGRTGVPRETGWPPQPGLALLRLAQGNVRLAQSLHPTGRSAEADPATRRQLLPALVEIELAAGDVAAADGLPMS